MSLSLHSETRDQRPLRFVRRSPILSAVTWRATGAVDCAGAISTGRRPIRLMRFCLFAQLAQLALDTRRNVALLMTRPVNPCELWLRQRPELDDRDFVND